MKINRFFSFLIRLHPVLYILLFFCVSYVLTLITYFFPAGAGTGADFMETSLEVFFHGIIVGPLFETLLHQALIIWLVCKLVKRPKYNFYLSILLSASLFALDHKYNIYYVIVAFIGGICLAFAYYMARYNRRVNPVLAVFLIHALYNAIAIYT